jgi:hypothetical protein
MLFYVLQKYYLSKSYLSFGGLLPYFISEPEK